MSLPFVMPIDVPETKQSVFINNYNALTRNTDRLFLFSCDQKIEHMNQDFFGPSIPPATNSPEHLFNIAQQGSVGALAAQFGLISRYARVYNNVNYIAKLNSKTNLITDSDPLSLPIWQVQEVADRQVATEIPIRGIGFTVYLGSKTEEKMLEKVGAAITQAHHNGLVAILWIYPRGQAITNEKSIEIIAGACGAANALGADFVKVMAPEPKNNTTSAELLSIATQAAGNTKVICSGGPRAEPRVFLQQLYAQIHTGNTAGCAVGRNVFQHNLNDAVAMTRAISAIVYENKTVEEAMTFIDSPVGKKQ